MQLRGEAEEVRMIDIIERFLAEDVPRQQQFLPGDVVVPEGEHRV